MNLSVQRVALKVDEALALPGDVVDVACAVEQLADVAKALELAALAVAQGI